MHDEIPGFQQPAPDYMPGDIEMREDFGEGLMLNSDEVTAILLNSGRRLTPTQRLILGEVSGRSEDGVRVSYQEVKRRLFGDDE